MNFYFDTEFLEGTQKRRVLGIPLWDTKPTIELISIGMVTREGSSYYAICKEFNLREAWYRHDIKKKVIHGDSLPDSAYTVTVKDFWIRENVLRPVFDQLVSYDCAESDPLPAKCHRFTYHNMRSLLAIYGKTRKEIAEDIKGFVRINFERAWLDDPVYFGDVRIQKNLSPLPDVLNDYIERCGGPRFIAYFADYDWVTFCWLFGKMLDLPKGWPMYCYDLKQKFDDRAQKAMEEYNRDGEPTTVIEKYVRAGIIPLNTKHKIRGLKEIIAMLKKHPDYPVNKNSHDALSDAYWNRDLDNFINKHLS